MHTDSLTHLLKCVVGLQSYELENHRTKVTQWVVWSSLLTFSLFKRVQKFTKYAYEQLIMVLKFPKHELLLQNQLYNTKNKMHICYISTKS